MPLSSGKRRRWIIACGALVVAAVAVLAVWARGDAARRAWRDQAVVTIQHRFEDKAWLDSELERLKPRAASRPYQGGWVGDELLVMKNGDWIICQNVCTKEQNTAVRKDLFIGRGSDGKWYYSTFHFCVGKCVLQIERQPDSLARFVDGYWLAPFDGKSDESLKVTWDGGPYGDDKLQSASAATPPRATKQGQESIGELSERGSIDANILNLQLGGRAPPLISVHPRSSAEDQTRSRVNSDD